MLSNRSWLFFFFFPVCSQVSLTNVCNRWHVPPLHSKVVVTLLRFLREAHSFHECISHENVFFFFFPPLFYECVSQKCQCVHAWVRLRGESRGWNKVTVISSQSSDGLRFSLCSHFAHHLLINSLCAKCVCVYVCVRTTSFMTSVSKPRGLQFSEKTLIWSDRTASGALLRGDLHCGGDPRVSHIAGDNSKKDLKRTRLLSLSECLPVPTPSCFHHVPPLPPLFLFWHVLVLETPQWIIPHACTYSVEACYSHFRICGTNGDKRATKVLSFLTLDMVAVSYQLRP